MDFAFLTIPELNRLYDQREFWLEEVTRSLLERFAPMTKFRALSREGRGRRVRNSRQESDFPCAPIADIDRSPMPKL